MLSPHLPCYNPLTPTTPVNALSGTHESFHTIMPTNRADDRDRDGSFTTDQLINPRSAEFAPYWLTALIESAEDAIISKTLDGIITSWNKGAQRIFGYTADEVIGKPVT